MDLILATTAQCGDCRLRWQGSLDDSAQCDRLHAGSNYWSIRCATGEAKKGKACKAVSNVVPPTSPHLVAQNMAAWDSKKVEEGMAGRREQCAQGSPAIQSPPRVRSKVVHEFRWMRRGCGSVVLWTNRGISTPFQATCSCIFHADPDERR
jgi:hypothetical protein